MLVEQPATLRVFFAVREDLYDWPGGDTVQVVHTAAVLRQLGVAVCISADDQADLSDFDCVHLWHLERVHETYCHLVHARAQGKPVVLSPIYWPRDDRPRRLDCSLQARSLAWREDAKNVWRYLQARSARQRRAVGLALRRGWQRCRQDILAAAAAVLPNSQAEAEIIAQESAVPLRCRVVPNGLDVVACQKASHVPAAGSQRGVLCVGHFDTRKNQLQLIKALRDTNVPVTFVGGARQMHQGYYRRCRRLAPPSMRFLGSLAAPDVLQLMRQSRVHVCPSRFETPGLANLEAAAMGCNLAVADCPPVREYFQEDVLYFAPDDPVAMREAVLKALYAPRTPHLARRVLRDYTWQAAARVTLAAYREVLGRAPG